MLRFRLALPLVCCAVASTFLAAQSGVPAAASSQAAPHFPTNEDLRHFKALAAPLLSPDGKEVLFTVTHATADGAASHLWIVPTATDSTDKPRQLTFSPPADKRGEHNAQWAPDGSAIFFLAKRGENTQLFRLDLRGGEASPYDLKILPPVDVSKDKDAINPPPAPESSDKNRDKSSAEPDAEKKSADTKPQPVEIDVAGFTISDDGKYLALWAHDPETPGEKKQKDAKIDASWINHEKHMSRLYLAALKSDGAIDGDLKNVDLPPDVHGAVWSPVADKLFVVTEAPNDASDLGPAGAAWIVDSAAPAKPVKARIGPCNGQRRQLERNGQYHCFRCGHSRRCASRLRRSLHARDGIFRRKAPESYPRICRSISRPEHFLHTGRRHDCAGSHRNARRRRPHCSRSGCREDACERHRSRCQRRLRPQHQPQTNRLGLACRFRRTSNAPLLCSETR